MKSKKSPKSLIIYKIEKQQFVKKTQLITKFWKNMYVLKPSMIIKNLSFF